MNEHPVTLINAFEVPPSEDADFIATWERQREFLGAQEGYISTKLHKSLAPTADFRYVNVAEWESPQAFQAATSQPEFRSLAGRFAFHASLYTVEREDDR